MGKLSAKIILVTGGSRGIGLAIAQACAREGATLAIAARESKPLRLAAQRLPGGTLAVAADVTRPASLHRLFGKIRERFGRLDVLVNSAGVFTYKPFVKTTLGDWRKNIEANLTSIFLFPRHPGGAATAGAQPGASPGQYSLDFQPASLSQLLGLLGVKVRGAGPHACPC